MNTCLEKNLFFAVALREFITAVFRPNFVLLVTASNLNCNNNNNMKMMKWKSCMTQLKKFSRKMEKVTQTSSYWGTGIALLEMRHTGTSLDHMG
jgi:hypothetical protein